jgi:hypothetical protein
MKKALSLLLCAALCFGLAVPSYADEAALEAEVGIEAEVEAEVDDEAEAEDEVVIDIEAMAVAVAQADLGVVQLASEPNFSMVAHKASSKIWVEASGFTPNDRLSFQAYYVTGRGDRELDYIYQFNTGPEGVISFSYTTRGSLVNGDSVEIIIGSVGLAAPMEKNYDVKIKLDTGAVVNPAGTRAIAQNISYFGFPLSSAPGAPPISGFTLFVNVDSDGPNALNYLGARRGAIIEDSKFAFNHGGVVNQSNPEYNRLNAVKSTGTWYSVAVTSHAFTSENGELVVLQFQFTPGASVNREFTIVWRGINGLDGMHHVDWLVDTAVVQSRDVFLGQLRFPTGTDPNHRPSSGDATIALRAAMELITLNDLQKIAADLYGDGRPVTSQVATQILRYAMMMIPSLPE